MPRLRQPGPSMSHVFEGRLSRRSSCRCRLRPASLCAKDTVARNSTCLGLGLGLGLELGG